MNVATPSEPLFGEDDRRIGAILDAELFNSKSVYNVPGYKPVRTELSHAPVRVTGTLPADLTGVYLRNGTNVQFDPTHIRSHAFAGAEMIHQATCTAARPRSSPGPNHEARTTATSSTCSWPTTGRT